MPEGSRAAPVRRSAERRRAPQRRRRRSLILGGAAGVLVVGAVVALIALAAGGSSRSGQGPEGVQSFAVAQRSHVQGSVVYPQTPPAGGNHAPVWQNCGFYDAPVLSENVVHSLEHGAVWITYRPELPPQQVDALRQLTRGQTFVLVSPYPDLPGPVVASAWGRQLRMETVEDPRLGEFVRAFRVGPQTPEPGAPCTGGTGRPT